MLFIELLLLAIAILLFVIANAVTQGACRRFVAELFGLSAWATLSFVHKIFRLVEIVWIIVLPAWLIEMMTAIIWVQASQRLTVLRAALIGTQIIAAVAAIFFLVRRALRKIKQWKASGAAVRRTR
jgi:hypothetical protein